MIEQRFAKAYLYVRARHQSAKCEIVRMLMEEDRTLLEKGVKLPINEIFTNVRKKITSEHEMCILNEIETNFDNY